MNANLLRSEMAKKGKTQAEVAQAIGMSGNSMSRKLLGKREFRLSEVCKLCDYLDIQNPREIFFSSSSHMRNENQNSA